MPTSVIQTNFPIKQENTISTEKPISTTNKKIIEENSLPVIIDKKNKPGKKVIELQKLKKQDVIIEEASTDDDEDD